MLTLILAAALTLPPQKSDAVIGVTAIHLESGRRVSVRGTERFPMGSVYKFPIGLTAMKRADSGTLPLDRKVTIEPRDFAPGWSPLRDDARNRPITITGRELVRHMVWNSDNTACDTLLQLVGGPLSVTTRMAELGFAGIRIDRSETQIAKDLHATADGVDRYAIDARDTSSPDAMAELLAAFWQRRDGLTKESHDLLVKWMTETPTGPRRIKAAMPANAVVTHKTGTMPGTANDVAIVTLGDEHVVVAVFTKKGTSELELREDDIAAAARAAFDAVMKRP
jgi:beta-lactamase class A